MAVFWGGTSFTRKRTEPKKNIKTSPPENLFDGMDSTRDYEFWEEAVCLGSS